MNDVMLSVSGLTSGYNGAAAIRDVNLEVRAGEVVALLGPNGAGKTTTLATIAGVLRPMAGSVVLDGRRLVESIHRRARNGLGYVTEERAIVRRLTVAENLRLGQGPASDALDLFPALGSLMKRKAGLLSGGEQQMLAMARVLSGRPRLLLVDELSFGLSPKAVDVLLDALRAAAGRGCGVLLVEQHPSRALSVSDRAYVLTRGHVALAGQADDMLKDFSKIEQAYLSKVSSEEQGPEPRIGRSSAV